MTEESLFAAALERENPDDRAAFLRSACAGDPALLARVEALLAAYSNTGDFLSTPLAPDGHTTPHPPTDSPSRPVTEGPGTVIGPYTLKEKIGEGGMGVVYLAEQAVPVRRTVALKVIKPGMDTAQVVSRFEAERQALALMDHPSIARVLDAGATDSGRPYFVMEFVSGEPITSYCDLHRLTPTRRLELLIPVCQAVQHAHQKGIIHRDLKPSNVLVTLVDGLPAPKVIDFGIAKAIDSPLTDRTLTQHGVVVGTPEYMSPEQAGASPDIDTRTDVYALGVILYELLTGSTPLQRESLRVAGLLEILRRVREEDPPRPSTRLSDSGERLPSISAVRGVEPSRLPRLVRGDLDWIVMKAIDKDRARRYDSPSAFALDIRRHLDGDPVAAGPPSRSYRLSKFARKYRAALTTAAAFALLLVAATAVSSYLAVRATSAETLADQRYKDLNKANEKTTKALVAVTAAKAQSDEDRSEAEGVSEFLLSAFSLRMSYMPDAINGYEHDPLRGGRDLKMVDLLDGAVSKLRTEFRGSDRIRLKLLSNLGMTYGKLGLDDQAVTVLADAHRQAEEKLGIDHEETLKLHNRLADAYSYAGRPSEANALHERTLKALQAKLKAIENNLGHDHLDTLVSRSALAYAYSNAGREAESIELYEATLKASDAALGYDDVYTLKIRLILAAAYTRVRRYDEALALYKMLYKILDAKHGPDDARTVESRNGLANVYLGAGLYTNAIAIRTAQLKDLEMRRGPYHADTLAGRESLALCYRSADRVGESIAIRKEILRVLESKLGPEHPDTIRNSMWLATDYLISGRHDESIALRIAMFKTLEAKLGATHPNTILSRIHLAFGYSAARRFDEEIVIRAETLKLLEAKLGSDHDGTIQSRQRLGVAYENAGRFDESIAIREAALKIRAAKTGNDNPITVEYRNQLANAYFRAGRLDEASRLYEATLKTCEEKLGLNHARTLESRNGLALVYENTGRLSEAIQLYETTLKAHHVKIGFMDIGTDGYRDNLARLYDKTGRHVEAVSLYETTLKAVEAKLGPDHFYTLEKMVNLGISHRMAGNTNSAIPLFEQALAAWTKTRGPDDRSTLSCRRHLDWCYVVDGRLSLAITRIEETLTRSRAKLGPDDDDSILNLNDLVEACVQAGHLDRAVVLWRADEKGASHEAGARARRVD